jgi:hypothetical protein
VHSTRRMGKGRVRGIVALGRRGGRGQNRHVRRRFTRGVEYVVDCGYFSPPSMRKNGAQKQKKDVHSLACTGFGTRRVDNHEPFMRNEGPDKAYRVPFAVGMLGRQGSLVSLRPSRRGDPSFVRGSTNP